MGKNQDHDIGPVPPDFEAEAKQIEQFIEGLLRDAIAKNASRILISLESAQHQDFPHIAAYCFVGDQKIPSRLRFPGNLWAMLVNKIKILSSLDICEKRKSQKGQFSTSVDGHALVVDIETQPMELGECLVFHFREGRASAA
ncbi:MAG: hypothetical protein HY928_13205 [Elusimicrobia bacterium]|nr:hypothetical protein [Elusimicrobiota bacterium]